MFLVVVLDSLQNIVIERFFSKANGIKNRGGLGTTVTDHTDASYTKQECPSMFGVVHALLDPAQVGF